MDRRQRQRRHPAAALLALALLAAPHAAHAALPQVDFDRMGKVGLAGSFAGLDIFDNSSAPFDPAAAAILARSPAGALSRLAATNDGGSVAAACTLGDTVYFAGNFSSVNGTQAANVVAYTPASGAFAAVGADAPNGRVLALYCDEKNSRLWAGGRFTSPSRAVAVWDGKAWAAPPFGGLAGAAAEVLSITTNATAASLFFAGSFLTSFAANATVPVNNTNNPNVPFSVGATPYSSSLVPVPLGGAQVVGAPSSAQSGFSDVSNILCPAGADGAGNTWFAADGNAAVITARTFRFLSASGVRLGNTFLDGRGTTGFSVATIPDNAIRTLQYYDPASGQNKTCTNCPLLTNSSIPYQDFLFDSALNITGVQVTLSEYTGAGPGLHLFQLLSSGAFASAVDGQNGQSCFAPEASNTTFTGKWTEKDANTGIAGTTENVLVSTVNVGTSAAQGPSFTWMPYVSAAGTYDLNLLVPGCVDFQDCALRTSVRVVVFPGGNLDPAVSDVDQRNQQDQSALIYSGPIVPSSPDFTVTVQMTLADDPAGTGQGGKYELVADRVQLVLRSANVTGTTSTGPGGNGTSGVGGGQAGFGFLEWPLSGGSTADATSSLPNSTETALDAVAIALYSGLGGSDGISTTGAQVINAVAHHSSGTIFLGGNFTLSSGSASGASNIVAYKNGALAKLADNGLTGAVSSLVLSGDELYVGGAFTGSSSTQSRGVIAYNVQSGQWSALSSGVAGAVASLALANGELQVAGNFTGVADGSVAGAGGLAVWGVANGTWVGSGGFLSGAMTLVSNTTAAKGADSAQYVAGSVAALRKYGASGFVMLSDGGDDGVPDVTPLSVQLGSGATSSASAMSRRRRRSTTHTTRAWFSTHIPRLFPRQAASDQAPLAGSSAASGPSVYAGAFWKNGSHEVTILGGNFTGAGGARNVVVYDASSGSAAPLNGAQPAGLVRALLVVDNTLYVGGQFTLAGSDAAGFAAYDLKAGAWVGGVGALAGGGVDVRSLTQTDAKDGTVVVAGTFASAGGVACDAICAFDTGAKAWSALGGGIQGDVTNVAYAGSKGDTLVAAGTITLNGAQANVAMYSFSNSSWTAVGSGLPGPVNALEVNGGNASSVFAAGRSSDGNTPFLTMWNGQSWNSVGPSLSAASNVSSMTMVPVKTDHDANGVIEKDRMLLVSGVLSDPSYGNVSSVLFDGQSFIPYIATTSTSGDPGSVSALIHSISAFSFAHRHVLATGIVILISIAIAAGIVFLLVLIGILWALFSRRDDDNDNYDPTADDDSSSHHRPTSLLAAINAATRNTILGTRSPYGEYSADKAGEAAAGAAAGSTVHGHDEADEDEPGFLRADTPSDGGVGDEGRVARARYSFDGGEEGELPLKAGTEVHILDDRDPAWWYAVDPATGREGVVPASYLV